MRIRIIALVVFIASGAAAPSAQEREITVWTARAIATVLAEIGSVFDQTTGYQLRVISDLSSGFANRLAAGEHADVIVSASSSVDQWIKDGRIVAETRTEIARSGIGVEVREGAAKPDISSVEAFKRAVLQAKSIAYLKVGSGLHMDAVFKRLGIAEAVQAKAVRPDTDIVSELVARGEIEMGMVVITQILTTPGVTFVGPLPGELQSHIVFTAGVGIDSRASEGARQLITFLTGPVARPVIRKHGMEPVGQP